MLYVVTAVYNRKEITKAFLNQLRNQSFSGIIPVVVDDGSTDGTSAMIEKVYPDAVILKGNGNMFWGGALDYAYKWLMKNTDDNDFVMFANDDTHFDNTYIERALSHFENEEDFLLSGKGFDISVGEVVDRPIFKDFSKCKNSFINDGENGNCGTTRSLFFKAKTMKKIGGFHPILLPHYGSDYEWTIRASRKGFPIRCYTDVQYEYDSHTTGDNYVDKLTLKKLFSKRSQCNPLYKISFLILSTPIKYLPVNLLHQFKRYYGFKSDVLAIVKRNNK